MASMCTHPYMAAHLSCPTGSSRQGESLTSFVLPDHNQGADLALLQGHALWRKFLPATSSLFVTTLLIQTLALQHLPVDAPCNVHGCFVSWELCCLSVCYSRTLDISKHLRCIIVYAFCKDHMEYSYQLTCDCYE